VNTKGILTFPDLVELRCVKLFAHHRVPLGTIVRIAHALARKIGPYPFTREDVVPAGRGLVARDLEGGLTDLETGQRVLAEFEPFLRSSMVYQDRIVSKWYPLTKEYSVAVSPYMAMGLPVIEGTGIRSDVVYSSYVAEQEDPEAVASEFGISVEQVELAVRFEREITAA